MDSGVAGWRPGPGARVGGWRRAGAGAVVAALACLTATSSHRPGAVGSPPPSILGRPATEGAVTSRPVGELTASSLSAGSVAVPGGVAAAVEGRVRGLVFADEVARPPGAPPDPARWTVESGSRGKGQLQYYTPDRNAYLDGRGHLVIETRRELTPGVACPTPEPAAPDNGTRTCRYTSARLSTRATARFTYGRFVARIRVTGGPGLLAAFWLAGSPPSGATGPWPTCR